MHADIREHVNSLIEEGLQKCSDRQVDLFRRMYSPNNVDAPLSDIVRKIPDGKCENAWDQVKCTVVKNEKRAAIDGERWPGTNPENLTPEQVEQMWGAANKEGT